MIPTIPPVGRALIFVAGLLFCLTPAASPPLALGLGIVLALLAGNFQPAWVPKATKFLLQASVVGLGFGLSFSQLAEAGRKGLLFTTVTIVLTMLAGLLIGRALVCGGTTTVLVSAGTAICGGSAIAALAPVLEARDEEVSVSLATVFLLNSLSLFLFPPLGSLLSLTQSQFGLWSAVAIHDTSSVVGAAARYGPEALQIATTVKLTRALWIVPIVFAFALARRKKTSIRFPWFILLFVGASVLRTSVESVAAVSHNLVVAARIGLTVTLFLIGGALSREALRSVGSKPLLLAVILWLLVSVGSLLAITAAD